MRSCSVYQYDNLARNAKCFTTDLVPVVISDRRLGVGLGEGPAKCGNAMPIDFFFRIGPGLFVSE